MTLEAGKDLGAYRIVSLLGAGGMGEVYRASDTRLGREVAIKVLPSELAGDSERLARFDREAKLLASLNHNNVASIHGFEEAEGRRFLVLELVEGEDLSERLSCRSRAWRLLCPQLRVGNPQATTVPPCPGLAKLRGVAGTTRAWKAVCTPYANGGTDPR